MRTPGHEQSRRTQWRPLVTLRLARRRRRKGRGRTVLKERLSLLRASPRRLRPLRRRTRRTFPSVSLHPATQATTAAPRPTRAMDSSSSSSSSRSDQRTSRSEGTARPTGGRRTAPRNRLHPRARVVTRRRAEAEEAEDAVAEEKGGEGSRKGEVGLEAEEVGAEAREAEVDGPSAARRAREATRRRAKLEMQPTTTATQSWLRHRLQRHPQRLLPHRPRKLRGSKANSRSFEQATCRAPIESPRAPCPTPSGRSICVCQDKPTGWYGFTGNGGDSSVRERSDAG